MLTFEIKNNPNYFVTKSGGFYKTGSGTQVKLALIKTPSGHKVRLLNETVLAINIYMQYFYPDYNGIDAVKYGVKGDNIVPKSISFIKKVEIPNLTPKENHIIFTYRCRQRADNANQRCTYKINLYDVLATLQRHNMNCHYCNETLRPHLWHLDHFYPLSKGGKNLANNLVPACARCNMMKSDMDGFAFIRKCLSIVKITSEYELPNDESLNPIKTKFSARAEKVKNKIKGQILFFDKKREVAV